MAIARDAATTGVSGANVSSYTLAHTTTGANRKLFVQVDIGNATDEVTSVTYGGVAMTLVNKQVMTAISQYKYLYYLDSPPLGANNVVVNKTSGGGFIGLNIVSYTGCGPGIDASNTGTGTGTTGSINVTVVATGCWIVNAGSYDNQVSHPTGNGVNVWLEGWDITAPLGDSNATVSTGAQATGWATTNGSQAWWINAVSFAPGTQAQGGTLLMMGV